MDLSGTWRALEADEALRRAFPDPDLDDSSWAEIDVPGHWRSAPAFAGTDGPLLYRRRFDGSRPDEGRRSWLVLDGLFYQGDVWLDGSYLGDTEGYFFPHTFEVTAPLQARDEHVVAVEVTCSRPADLTAKRNLTGVFQHWDCLDPDWNPGGIWRPVRVEETGPVRINRLRVLCPEATAERARIDITAELDAAAAGAVELRTTVGIAIEHTQEQQLAAGINQVTWRVTVEQPLLWWPHALGGQHLYDVLVEVTPVDGAVSDTRTVRTGLREIRMKRWIATVNGERLFLKGSNHGPTRMALGEATATELEHDVVLAKEAGLDLLRIHAHVTRPELYDAADRHGLLLWQDLPLQWGYARGVRKQAVRQAREAVDLLGHHPSLAIWCGHNEPLALDLQPGVSAGDNSKRLLARFAAQQQLPTFNKTVLDGSIKRALERNDPTRPVVPHSGVLPHPGSGGTDSHLYFGWYHGDERGLQALCAHFPRLARFITEFGAQAVPASDAFMAPEQWPDLDWERLGHHHALQKAIFDRRVPPSDHATFDSWRKATQEYQATVIRHHVETLRRLKYRPAGGFCQFSFADGHPAVSWSVLDHDRVPKLGLDALTAACAPVIITADRPPAEYRQGQPIVLDIHAVSDLRTPVEAALVTATLRWPGGEQQWWWEGDIPADDCVRIGTVQALAPDTTGRLTLDLSLESATVKATNGYESFIARSAE
ncbi:MAG: beta-mannosidase [Acidimicrobiaceae bacterium]|nr:beta-mannosidase [Acidimicrobiaceae bacterium]